MQRIASNRKIVAILATVGLMAVVARAATVTNNWIHGGSDYKWSTAANWDGGALTGQDVIVFTNIAVAGGIGNGGTPDNIVDQNQTI
ncbi:MAG TPA: hypothetical protein P5205_07220 [Candidatus Paceibacterota bacterium]|nr:hypothetical protein [Verrucomicrobiota bacterium]HSA10148.1 hypothetical protein [Candidatus Paceibacterota bacterium]